MAPWAGRAPVGRVGRILHGFPRHAREREWRSGVTEGAGLPPKKRTARPGRSPGAGRPSFATYLAGAGAGAAVSPPLSALSAFLAFFAFLAFLGSLPVSPAGAGSSALATWLVVRATCDTGAAIAEALVR